MEKSEISHEYQDIRLATDKGSIPEIDILEQVMGTNNRARGFPSSILERGNGEVQQRWEVYLF